MSTCCATTEGGEGGARGLVMEADGTGQSLTVATMDGEEASHGVEEHGRGGGRPTHMVMEEPTGPTRVNDVKPAGVVAGIGAT